MVKNKQKAYKHIYLCTSRTGRLHSTAGRGAVGSNDLVRARAVGLAINECRVTIVQSGSKVQITGAG